MRHNRLIAPSALALGLCVFTIVSFGAVRSTRGQQGPFEPWTGQRGITETVAQIMARQAALPPEALDRPLRLVPEPKELERDALHQDPASPSVGQWPPLAPPQQQNTSGSLFGGHGGPLYTPQTVALTFQAVQISEGGYVPPDSGGAVGPTQILVQANGRVKVFDKLGNVGGLNASADVFFNSVRGGSAAVDPQCAYDRSAGRFIATCITTSVPNRVVIGVSSGSVITSQSSFTFFFFQQDQVTPLGNTGEFADYDKIGVDAGALYIGANMFDSALQNFTGSTGFVVKKSSILGAGPIQATAFRGMCSPTGPGPSSPIGITNDDAGSTEGYFIGVSNNGFGKLTLKRISNPGGSPSISADLDVIVPTTGLPQSQPALGSSNDLDSIDDRLIYAMAHKNRLTGATSLWATHQIVVDAAGASAASGRNGVRWYQVANLTSTPSLTQAGTLFDPSSTNTRGHWFGAAAMSGQGHMALACTYAGANDHAGIAAAGRWSNDALGTIGAPTLAITSSSAYNAQGSSPQRWGDMACMWVDPADDQTLWGFAENCNATNSWAVSVVKLVAPPPALPVSCVPASVAQSASNVNVVLTGTSSAASGFFDTEAGMNRIAASVAGSGVTVNSIVFTDPTTITLNVSVSAGATTGARVITVTNPDGQSASSASGILTVTGNSPIVAFCAGDGTLTTACPCANFGTAGHGCNNSIASGGALLGASGSTSPDTVVMNQTLELVNSLSIFLQGDVNTAAGVVFGDGVRCVNGNLKRIGVKSAVGGSVSYPQGGDLSITAKSAALGDTIPSGATRYYQVYYRDPSAIFCPSPLGDTFDVGNGLQVTW